MQQLVNTHDKLAPAPSAASSQHDFDFLVGHWKIYNRKLKTRLAGCTGWLEFDAHQEMRHILNGTGNMDIFKTTIDDKSFEGMTLRLFDPVSRLWSIYWADSNAGKLDPPVIGSFENNIGTFACRDVFNGKDILVKFIWDKTNPEQPVWSQAFSDDGGKTWEWNWYMYMTRATDETRSAQG
jgi:hypothetical protein